MPSLILEMSFCTDFGSKLPHHFKINEVFMLEGLMLELWGLSQGD